MKTEEKILKEVLKGIEFNNFMVTQSHMEKAISLAFEEKDKEIHHAYQKLANCEGKVDRLRKEIEKLEYYNKELGDTIIDMQEENKKKFNKLKEELIQNLCIEPSHIERTNEVIDKIFKEDLNEN